MMKLADLILEHADELAALESLDNGKAFSIARAFDGAHPVLRSGRESVRAGG